MSPQFHRSCHHVLWCGLCAAALIGCANSNRSDESASQRSPASAPAAVQNQRTAAQLLKEAEDSERSGDSAHAMEVYTQLKSFPAESRPRDLERRIENLRRKMNAQPNR